MWYTSTIVRARRELDLLQPLLLAASCNGVTPILDTLAHCRLLPYRLANDYN